VRLCKIAIKLLISSLIVDKPKLATGNGDIEDKKLNFPAPDDNTTAFEAYHFGNKRDTIKETNATMIVFFIINLLLVQNKREAEKFDKGTDKIKQKMLFALESKFKGYWEKE
jgi:hypothetical protein